MLLFQEEILSHGVGIEFLSCLSVPAARSVVVLTTATTESTAIEGVLHCKFLCVSLCTLCTRWLF